MTQIILITAISVFFFMLFFYIIAQLLKNNGIVDIGWGLGFITILAILHIYYPELYMRKILVTLMVVLWGFRLSIHIFLRSLGKSEDFRYANWRRKWGKRAYFISFFKVFMLQGLVMVVIAVPIMLIFNSNPIKYSIFDIVGVIVFLTGFYFEAMGDYQLTEFRKKPENKGKIITSGLWKYTRHPNYFGDALVWWGIGIVAIPADWGLAGLVSPLLMTYLLVNVSGVPMLEKKYEGRADWEAYKQKTPMFVPKFGKKRFH